MKSWQLKVLALQGLGALAAPTDDVSATAFPVVSFMESSMTAPRYICSAVTQVFFALVSTNNVTSGSAASTAIRETSIGAPIYASPITSTAASGTSESVVYVGGTSLPDSLTAISSTEGPGGFSLAPTLIIESSLAPSGEASSVPSDINPAPITVGASLSSSTNSSSFLSTGSSSSSTTILTSSSTVTLVSSSSSSAITPLPVSVSSLSSFSSTSSAVSSSQSSISSPVTSSRPISSSQTTSAAPPGTTIVSPIFADQQNALDAHNRARAAVGVPPLAWDTNLELAAIAYSADLAQRGVLEHGSTGENLYFAFPVNSRPFLDASNAWIAEKPLYNNEPIPQGDFEGYGHYTQVVWRSTQFVGIGSTINGTSIYVVARYSPVGNIVGQTPF